MTAATATTPTDDARAPTVLWLALGALLIASSQLRTGIVALAPFAAWPLLHWAMGTRGSLRRALGVGGALIVGWSLAGLSIVTEPLPLAMAPIIGLALGVMGAPAPLVSVWARRALGPAASIVGYAATATLGEWGVRELTPFSSWGAAAYAVRHDLALTQSVSVVGLAGLSLLLHASSAAGFEALLRITGREGARAVLRPLAIPGALLAAAYAWGTWRTTHPWSGPWLRTATVATTTTFMPDSLPDAVERDRIFRALFDDTRRAAAAGARVVVWNEGSVLVLDDEMPRRDAEVSALAAELGIHIVVGSITPREPRYLNELRWYGPHGLSHTYTKHRPAPFEPAIVGTEPMTVVEVDGARLSGAICYDYSDPAIAALHGDLGVDVAVLPASDWRGIDPIHAEMASLRAIEQGMSLVRSTRLGRSVAVDPTGRVRAERSWFEGSERVMIADVPARGSWTLHRATGDLATPLSAGALAVLLALAIARRRAPTLVPHAAR